MRIEIRKAARALFWVLAGVIPALALYPRLTLPELQATQGMTQYFSHALAFSVLVIVGAVCWGLRRSLVAGVAVSAIGLELAQTLSPGRQTNLPDMLASLAGVALGYALACLLPAVLREPHRVTTEVYLKAKNQ